MEGRFLPAWSIDEAGPVTGAVGQIGSELTLALRERYGGEAGVASDVRMPTDVPLRDGGPSSSWTAWIPTT